MGKLVLRPLRLKQARFLRYVGNLIPRIESKFKNKKFYLTKLTKTGLTVNVRVKTTNSAFHPAVNKRKCNNVTA